MSHRQRLLLFCGPFLLTVWLPPVQGFQRRTPLIYAPTSSNRGTITPTTSSSSSSTSTTTTATSEELLLLTTSRITPIVSLQQSRDNLEDSDRSNNFLPSPKLLFKAPSLDTSFKTLVGLFALSTWGITILSAKIGILPGTIVSDGFAESYTDLQIFQDMGATLLSTVLGYLLVKAITWAATPTETRDSYLKPRDSRKIIHTVSAPAFIVFWPIFSTAIGAKCFAATVPMINAVRLYLAATTDGGESDLAAAISRSGNRMEAAGGPFIYVIIMTMAILAFWRDSPTGVVALSTMAAGDGLADIIGRRFGKSNQWPAAITGSKNRKSVAGSFAMIVGSVLTSLALLSWLHATGSLATLPPLGELTLKLIYISAAAAFCELIPIADDNYTVPFTAAILSFYLLG